MTEALLFMANFTSWRSVKSKPESHFLSDDRMSEITGKSNDENNDNNSFLFSSLLSLDLSRNDECLPSRLSHLPTFPKLWVLQMREFSLHSLSPKFFSKFPSLLSLDLRNNFLSKIPPSIFSLSLLQVLKLSNNQIQFIDQKIEKLTQLKILELANNKLEFLSVGIGKLTQLTLLNVSNNRLKSPPSEIVRKGTKEIVKWLEGVIPGRYSDIHLLSSLKKWLSSLDFTDLQLVKFAIKSNASVIPRHLVRVVGNCILLILPLLFSSQ